MKSGPLYSQKDDVKVLASSKFGVHHHQPLTIDEVKPLTTQESIDAAVKTRQKFYSQTEINEAEEDFPEEEVADEIPD